MQFCSQRVIRCAFHGLVLLSLDLYLWTNGQPCARSSTLLWLRVCVFMRVCVPCLQHQLLNVPCP